MIEFFMDTRGRTRLLWSIGLILANLGLLFFLGLVWFWLWAVAAVMFLSFPFGEF